MSNFTTVNLTGERVLVKGQDYTGATGETVVSAGQWNRVKQQQALANAKEDFDSKVEEFFAPITEAADAFKAAGERPEADPISYVVVHEGTEGVQGRDEVRMQLSPDSIVLRLIEEGDTDRLVWVGDTLEVIETLPVKTQRVTIPEQGGDPHANEPDEG